MIDIDGQSQILPYIFVLTSEKALEERNDSAMQILIVMVGLLSVEGGHALHLLLLALMLVKL